MAPLARIRSTTAGIFALPFLVIAIWAGLSVVACGQLLSVDEAMDESAQTGRPIFALAGNKT